ncbi:zinc ribbon domain-containing protein [Desulfonema magnum]|nr:zinc ribbon domain-containing protein [Desulfonema magnum]
MNFPKMEPLTHDEFSELKSFFIGEPRDQTKVWVTAVKTPHLSFEASGAAYLNDERTLDFGSVPAIGDTSELLTIANLGQTPLTLAIEGGKDWLKYKCRSPHLRAGGDRTDLELFFHGEEHGEEIKSRELTCPLLIKAKTPSGTEKEFPLHINIKTHTHLAYGKFDFNGKAESDIHDFGSINPTDKGEISAYRLSIENCGKEALKVKFEDCPEWLTADVLNVKTSRKETAFQISPGETAITIIRPVPSLNFLGTHSGRIICRSNDVRKKYKKLELEFQCVQEIQDAYIVPKKPESIEIIPNRTYTADIPVSNWGKTPAQVSVKSQSQWITLPESFQIPAIKGQKPGEKSLQVTIRADQGSGTGRQTTNLELTLLNGNQEPVHIPVETDIIGIECDPESLDFGTVNVKDTPTRSTTFKATDDRELYLKAKPLPGLEENLSVVVKGHTVEAKLEDVPLSGSRLVTHDGPGIIVQDSSGYEQEFYVKFQRTAPSFEADTQEIDMGEIVGGTTAKGHFNISNKGDGVLIVDMRSDSDKLRLKAPQSFDLSPGSDADIYFTLNSREDIETEQQFGGEIIIRNNDPSRDDAQKIPVRAKVLRPEGKLCPSCFLLVSLNHPYCPLCGTPVKDAAPVSDKGLAICPKCKRKFKPEKPFCPKDGKRLKLLN